MVLRSCEQVWRKGPWTPEEDKLLSEHVNLHGEGRWSSVARCTGLNRSGKSCRLRWVNYLRPGLRKDHLTPQEEGIIIELHALWGNKWSTIAKYFPGRTDNEIKNYWRTHFKKKGQTSQKQENLKTDQTLGQKQKQEQQQPEEEEEEQQQQQREEKHEDDTNQIILPHAKEKVQELISKRQGSQEQVFMETTTIEQQCWPYEDVAPWSGSLMDQDGLWAGLWNLDDNPSQGCINQAGYVYCKKRPTQNQATHFTCGTDTSKPYTPVEGAFSRQADPNIPHIDKSDNQLL